MRLRRVEVEARTREVDHPGNLRFAWGIGHQRQRVIIRAA
jgi:hypothetical protein